MLMPDRPERLSILRYAVSVVDDHLEALRQLPVAPSVKVEEIRDRLHGYDFSTPRPAKAVIDDTMTMLRNWTVHNAHPRYFGLFNPTPSLMGITADLITATVNPQLAVWSQSPAAVEIERHVVDYFAGLFGLDSTRSSGQFTSGGSEANLTALLVALTRSAPRYADEGLRAFAGPPTIYASQDSHLAWFKIAHVCGIGRDAVRLVATDSAGRLNVDTLADRIADDRKAGSLPVMVVATAGTTGTGVIDPLSETADLCAVQRLHLHVDAAWGGAAILSDRLAPLLGGISRAATITLDAHKWLSAPMGAGMLLSADGEWLSATFRVSTSFMPESGAKEDPYMTSLQWSRRFIGLKLFLTLATESRSGYAAVIDRQTGVCDHLRGELAANGWRIVNATPLPVVCFVDDRPGCPQADSDAVAAALVASGKVWVSTLTIGTIRALRASVTSYLTDEADIGALVDGLASARESIVAETSLMKSKGIKKQVQQHL